MASSDSSATGLSPNLDTEVGRVIVEMGLATRTEIDFCREQQKQSSDPNQRSLADVLIEHNFITVNQAKRVKGQLEEVRKSSSQIPGYQLLSKLGKGAMATVYKARQVSLDRIVAVKVLPRRSSDNPEFVERFYKEGKAAARLSHNHIVQAIDVGSSPDGYHFFVMEYVEGNTLYDFMQPPPLGEGRTFTEQETLDIMIQMCDALVHAHERGLIHRDVKPKNILLTAQGVAKLTDLGLARALDDREAAQSEAGKAYGTPYYISPEQIRGEVDIDFRADIYSLGATMYHMVTGRPPFDGETPSAVMHKHLKQPLVPADHINTSLSAGIAEIIDVAMAKNPAERYQSTLHMLEDLRSVRSGKPPFHARRNIDLDAIAQIEQTGTVEAGQGEPRADGLSADGLPRTGKTVDIATNASDFWSQPAVMWMLIIAGLSLMGNIILVAALFLLN